MKSEHQKPDRWERSADTAKPNTAISNRFTLSLKCERGNVESALTLIPLMLLFLSVMQVGVGVYGRITSDQMTQGSVARQAMGMTVSEASSELTNPAAQLNVGTGNSSGSGGTDDSFMAGLQSEMDNVGSVTAIPLPGGGSLDFAGAADGIPSLTPLLPQGDRVINSGVAVQE